MGMLSTMILFCSLAFAETKTLAVQICLDRAGYSCNTIDGQWGRKSQRAFEKFFLTVGKDKKLPPPSSPDEIYDRYFANAADCFRIETVTQEDLDSLVRIPGDAAGKAHLPRMGYETVKEMFAERGHLSQRALERINPGVDWDHVKPGLKLVIPDFPSIREELAAGDRQRRNAPKRPLASLVRVSLSNFEISAFDENGKCLALFPCSIAQDKSKLPPHGEMKITSYIARPNYTYSPDFVPKGKKAAKYIFPEGPNCPVGIAWMGLSLPGYGIHGTPKPESIGSAESHGCFRLANWNAARLYALCKSGTRVIVEQ